MIDVYVTEISCGTNMNQQYEGWESPETGSTGPVS